MKPRNDNDLYFIHKRFNKIIIIFVVSLFTKTAILTTEQTPTAEGSTC